MNELGVGVIGLGFMGRIHVNAYGAAAADGAGCRLIAVCDRDAERRTGRASSAGNMGPAAQETLFDPSIIPAAAEASELFANERIGLVSICTPTDTHAALAIAALEAGKHVLVEKPVALCEADVRRVADAAERAQRICMPAMCMRFWPAWMWLREAIASASLGAVRTARFERMGAPPTWASDFYLDESRSGGALFDLHVHDADFVVACFGLPRSVDARGDRSHVATRYHFERGPLHVEAEGGWLRSPSTTFRMRYTVEFERGVADFDFARDPQLLVHSDEGTFTPPLSAATGYDGEIRCAIDAALGRRRPEPTMQDAALVTRVLEAEVRSLETGVAVPLAARG